RALRAARARGRDLHQAAAELTDLVPESAATRELRSNKAIEDAAVGWVIESEQRAGRDARDTRYRREPADIESPPRLIEVKACGGSMRGTDLWLEPTQF